MGIIGALGRPQFLLQKDASDRMRWHEEGEEGDKRAEKREERPSGGRAAADGTGIGRGPQKSDGAA